jgi:hypothetical protein
MRNNNLIIATSLLAILAISGCSHKDWGDKPSATVNVATNIKETVKEVKVANDIITTEFAGASFKHSKTHQNVQESNAESPQFIAFLMNADKSNFNLVIETLPGKFTLEQYVAASSGVAEVEQKNFEADGYRWNEVVREQGGLKLNQRTFLADGKAYVFTYAALPGSYEKHLQEFIDITKTIKLAK